MIFALAYLGNAAANFVFGLVVSAALGPAEFGRYATAALAASVLAALAFDWLRLLDQPVLAFQARPDARFGNARGRLFLVSGLLVGAPRSPIACLPISAWVGTSSP